MYHYVSMFTDPRWLLYWKNMFRTATLFFFLFFVLVTRNCSYLGGLVVRGVEALDGDFSEDVWLQRLLSQVTVVNDGWMQQKKNSFVLQSLNRFGNVWGNDFSILPIQK